ncbi:hypothetical protein PAXINDRAFT_99758 [Paxillus involutus ATCC 200175]|uniref:WD40 repeat-like protein n=1 Tax=Paxillus involutus ATCC 200175 TaxID=664439 RepID=A0A0C9TXG1_PAXIN|nr:hypothetical protein PAXINDRAFT_99758 [Paxillus involutus ATCC 200175]
MRAERDLDGDRENPDEQEEPVTPNLQPLHVLEGHTDSARWLASISNCDLFVSGSDDGSCTVWNAKDGCEVGKKMVHGGKVYAIVVSRDGKTMASGGNDGRVVVWSLDSREKIIEWDTESEHVWSLAMSQDSHTLVSGHGDGIIMQWNASTGDRIAGPYKFHDHDVSTVSFSADDSRIASGSYLSGDIRVTYSHSGEDVIPPFKAHDEGIWSLVWLPNGQLISASRDNKIKFWDTSDGSLLIATSLGHTHSVNALATSCDGKLLASALDDGTARLWSTSTHEQIGPALKHPTDLLSVALSSNGHYLAAAGDNRKVYIWNLMDIKELAEIIARKGPSLLDLPAILPPDAAKAPYYAREGGFWTGLDNSRVGADRGKAKAEDVELKDELDSHERRRLFGAFNKKIFKPLRAIGSLSKPPTDLTQDPAPARKRLIAALKLPAPAFKSSLAQIEQPAGEATTSGDTSSIHSSGAGPSGHPSRPSFWRQSRSSPVLQVTTVAAGRARPLLAGRQPPDPPTRRLPHSLKPDDPKNKPWHNYLLKKQTEHRAQHQKPMATSPRSPTRDTPPQDRSPAPTADAGTSTPQPSAQSAPTTSAEPADQSQHTKTRRPPSEISLTGCDMFCLWFWRSEPRWGR